MPTCCATAVGSSADWLRNLADGIDDRQVEPNREVKSSGSENTYSVDLTDIDEIRQEIDEMARERCRRGSRAASCSAAR